MHIKSILIVLIISAVYLHESEAVPKPLGLIKGKIAVAKAKLAIAKAPHLIASAIVAKEVKAKTKIAFAKAVAAAKAAKVAAKSIILAPFKKVKTKIAVSLAGLKLLKALKVAKIAKTVAILKNLKKSPIILPVPVVLPVGKSLPGILGGPAAALAIASATGAAAPATEAPNQLDGFLTTATKALQAAGAGLPLLAAFQNSQKKEEVEPVTPSPVYRFVPEVGFTNYNKVSYQPRLEIEVPAPINYYPAYPVAPLVPVAPLTPIVQAAPIVPVEPVVPAAPIVPAEVYGLPGK